MSQCLTWTQAGFHQWGSLDQLTPLVHFAWVWVTSLVYWLIEGLSLQTVHRWILLPIHLANPHSWGPSISSRARLCWCQTTLCLSFHFPRQPEDSGFTSLLLLKPWLNWIRVIFFPLWHVHASPLPLTLPLDFLPGSNLSAHQAAPQSFLCYMLMFWSCSLPLDKIAFDSHFFVPEL